MNIHLTIVDGPARTSAVRLRKRDTIIGRQKGCDIRIPSDEVSRRHCLLFVEGDRLTIEDLRSANGTFINGNRVKGRQIVRSGDRLQVGPLIFRIDLPKVGKKPTADESEDDKDPVYHFADDAKSGKKKEIEIELEPDALDHLPEGNDFRDLLKGMDR